MSTSVVEVTRLEDLVTIEPPPCEILFNFYDGRKVRCGKPSVYRLTRRCTCGAGKPTFVCKRCYGNIKDGVVACDGCRAPITEWRVLF